MTITRVGTNAKYATGWENIFTDEKPAKGKKAKVSGKKGAKPAPKAAAAKKSTKKPAPAKKAAPVKKAKKAKKK